MADCIFCKIVDGEIPSAKIYEDDQVLAFLDITPVIPGHSLVIPKTHCENLLDAPPEVLAACSKALQIVAGAVFEGMKADGLNVLQNNHEVAGQVIEHLHFHIIPRFRGDGFKVPWPAAPYPVGEIEKVLQRIQAALP